LYFHPVSTASRPVVLFCAEEHISYEPHIVDLMTGAHLQAPYIGVNPNGLVPALDDDGFVLTESSAILKYLAEKTGSKAYPKDLKARARVNEMMDWFNTQLYREWGYHLTYPQLFPHHVRKPEAAQTATIEWGKTQSERWMKVLDARLADNKFLCGDEITIADYFGAGVLATGDIIRVSYDRFPNVKRWVEAMHALPSWKKINEATDGFTASLREKEFVTFA